jgi:hypothetical protein
MSHSVPRETLATQEGKRSQKEAKAGLYKEMCDKAHKKNNGQQFDSICYQT